MTDNLNIAIPSKPEMLNETDTEGTYEISGLYPGYGNTLGNALRRILLSSMPGAAITAIRIRGVSHEFSTVKGVQPDVLTVVLNMKNIRIRTNTDVFPQTITLKKKGKGVITAGDFESPTQLDIINKDLVIAEITDDKGELNIEADIHQGIGFCAREDLVKERETTSVGSIMVDAIFSPVKRSSYEVQNMRVGDRTDFNRLNIYIETDGTVAPREALERALRTMIAQFEAMLGFQSDNGENMRSMEREAEKNLRTVGIADLGLTASVENILEKNNIKTMKDILKKGTVGISDIPGIGVKAVEEIKNSLERKGIVLKDNE